MKKTHWLYSMPIAHRGLHNLSLPENSIPAIEKAVENNYAIEIDVQITKDNQLIVFHDYSTKRMTGENFEIKDLTLSQLKELSLLNTSCQIPLLEEILQIVNGKVPLLIEVKNDGKSRNLEAKLCHLLNNYLGAFAVQSFNPMSLSYIKKVCPKIMRGQLSSNFINEKMSCIKKYVLKNFLLNFKSSPNFIAFKIEDLPNKKIEKFRRKNICVLAWTIKTKSDLEKAKKHCDNIIFEEITP